MNVVIKHGDGSVAENWPVATLADAMDIVTARKRDHARTYGHFAPARTLEVVDGDTVLHRDTTSDNLDWLF